jgi:hypothetical protein
MLNFESQEQGLGLIRLYGLSPPTFLFIPLPRLLIATKLSSSY